MKFPVFTLLVGAAVVAAAAVPTTPRAATGVCSKTGLYSDPGCCTVNAEDVTDKKCEKGMCLQLPTS